LGDPARSLPSYGYLSDLMSAYRVEHLAGLTAESFEANIRSLLELEDHRMEGFDDPSQQRDRSVCFVWGHDHDFGSFALGGAMADRHLTLLATFIDRFAALPPRLDGKRVLDIGCWTGGTSLLLSAMGAEVVAIEEVRKYVDAVGYLKEAFGIDRLEVRNQSLFECTTDDFIEAFDIVLFAGVLFHVTDPVLALRIIFGSLRDGGVCLLETAADPARRPLLDYRGPGPLQPAGIRRRWSWMVPSVPALTAMMGDVGFDQVRAERARAGRAFAIGRRSRYKDMLRAGLSLPKVR
jgi:2-polyprenyl-3-methyl-5-hydroxy-6-metoxy-1,4-benzoquinol methylase